MLLSVPSALDSFFKTGPFAWNGLLVFWVPAAAFCVWMAAMVRCTLQAIDAEHAAVPTVVDGHLSPV